MVQAGMEARRAQVYRLQLEKQRVRHPGAERQTPWLRGGCAPSSFLSHLGLRGLDEATALRRAIRSTPLTQTLTSCEHPELMCHQLSAPPLGRSS